MKKLFQDIPKEIGDYIDKLQREDTDRMIRLYRKFTKQYSEKLKDKLE